MERRRSADHRPPNQVTFARVLKRGGRFVGSVFLTDGGIRYLPMVTAGRLAGVMGPSGGMRDLERWFDDARDF